MGFLHTIEHDGTKLLKVLDIVGRDTEVALADLEKYQVPVEAIASIAFPGAGAAVKGIFTVIDLIQNAILVTKQKYSPSPGTPAQMLADEVRMVAPAVSALLAKENITYSTAQVQSLVTLVLAALNAQPLPPAPSDNVSAART